MIEVNRLFVFWIVLLGLALAANAEEPTLVRLSFAVPPAQMAAFETAYQQQLVPILQTHGLSAAAEQNPTSVDSIFSRVFSLKTPADLAVKWQALTEDPAWQALLQQLGKTFGPSGVSGPLAFDFGHYRTPAGPGTVVAAQGSYRQGQWQSFGVENGLSFIVSTLVDRRGHLWFGTSWFGVTRFDGVRFTTFTNADGLAANGVNTILEDRQGNLWFGTEGGGISCYNGKTFTTFTTADGLASNQVISLIAVGQDQVWALTQGGVSRYAPEGTSNAKHAIAGQQWVLFANDRLTGGVSRYAGQEGVLFADDHLTGDWISAILQDRQGNLWFGSGHPELAAVRVSRYAPQGTSNGKQETTGEEWITLVDDRLAANWISAILQDRQGNLWFGTNKGVTRYDGHHFTPVKALAGDNIRAIAEDDQGHLWFAGSINGVHRFDGQSWDRFTSVDGLANDQVSSIAKDQQGNLWFGTITGVSRRDQGTFTHFTSAQGLVHNGVLSILEDRQGTLWFGTFGGASRYDGTEFTTVEPLLEWDIWSMVEDRQGALWFSDDSREKGVMRYDGTQFTPVTRVDGLLDNSVWCIYEDRQGHMWFGSRQHQGGGVSRYIPEEVAEAKPKTAGQGWTTFTKQDGLGANRVRAILEDRHGHMWFATTGGGMSRYNGEEWINFTTSDGLGNIWPMAILEDRQGTLWVGTFGGGVSRYLPEGAAKAQPTGPAFQTLTHQDGLVYDNINALMEDNRGHLWIGTYGGGVSRYDGQVFQTLSRQDGLIHNAVQAFLQDREGNIWIGTEGGITRYRPSTVPPTIQLQDVSADQRYAPVDTIRIATAQKLVRFGFQGYSMSTRPERMVYRYRLQGYQEKWQTTHETQVEYAQLPVGAYQFQVQAVDRDLNYSETTATVALEIYQQTFAAPVRLSALKVEDVFVSFYPAYANQPLGSVQVANQTAAPLEATLRFYIPDLMQQPFEQALTLDPQANEEVALHANLQDKVLQLQGAVPVQAEIAVAFASGGQTVSIQDKHKLQVYGRGALRWDQVERAAAFITSDAPAVVAFARPLLVAFETQVKSLGAPGKNLLQALVLFQGLKEHGVRYLTDANTAYAQASTDKGTIDHIQYPAEVLHKKAGDCDDLTVLFCSLLENAGVATALVDYPGHLFLLFDTGVHRQQAYLLPLGPGLYVERRDHLWIPLEITKLDADFHQAWRLGAQALNKLSERQQRQLVVDTAEAWAAYPATTPSFEEAISPPAPARLNEPVAAQVAILQQTIDAYIDKTYLKPLHVQPDNDALRTQLLKVYLALNQFDKAIDRAETDLLQEQGDKAATLNQLGNAFFMTGNRKRAALYYKQALDLRPDNQGIADNLKRALEAAGLAQPDQADTIQVPAAISPKDASFEIDVERFYWLE